MAAARVLHALAEVRRQAILDAVGDRPRTISELAAPMGVTLMAVQQHVAVLESAGLVATEKVGRSRVVHLRLDGLQELIAWLTGLEARWHRVMDGLASYAAKSDPNKRGKRNAKAKPSSRD